MPTCEAPHACASAQLGPVCTSTAKPQRRLAAWVISLSINACACSNLSVGTSKTSSSWTVRSILATGSLRKAASTPIIAFLRIAAASEHRGGEAIDLCLLHLRCKKLPHFGKLRVVSFDKTRRFIHFDAEPLRDSVGRHAVSNAIGELFDLIAHGRGHIARTDV